MWVVQIERNVLYLGRINWEQLVARLPGRCWLFRTELIHCIAVSLVIFLDTCVGNSCLSGDYVLL